MEMITKTQKEIEQEMLELNEQFKVFLHTKGISAKFKIAIANMCESAHKQHQADVAKFNAVKAQSAEDNAQFAEFLHTKGIKAKYRLVVENIKKGAAESPFDTSAQIAKVQAQTQQSIARANAINNPYGKIGNIEYSATSLEDEFNAFLKSKGLDEKYCVAVTEE